MARLSPEALKERSKFRILGPLEVEGAALGGPRPRALLLTLLLAPNQTVSRERLIDAAWPDDPPESARHALQVYISTLRKAIGPERIVTEPTGYRVVVAEHELDALAFRARLRAQDLPAALALWRGPIESTDPAAAELEALRVKAQEDHFDAEPDIPALERHTREHPQRERAHGQLMRALYGAGRQADALAAYRTARTALDELGLTPSEELRRLELAILRHAQPRLPTPLTPLIGRRREVAEVAALVCENRLVTLVGPGGVGKTRIALEAARRPGAVFVDLAPLRDPALVAGTIEAALEDEDELLLLDNFEHVDAAATVVSDLLRATPHLRCLVTSRNALRLYGEHVYTVAQLELWDEAVPLFVARARAAGAAVEPSDEIAAVCERLDRLPLALELVAAAPARDLPPRQQSLSAAIAWSVDLLEARLRERFHALAVFAGGWDAEAAAAVADASSGDLAALAARSLITRDPRYGMLATIREFATVTDAVRDRHADHYRALAEHADRELRGGGDQAAWLARLDTEHANLRAALDHRPGDVRLAGALAAFWNVRGHSAEGLDRITRALAHTAEPAARARALAGASGLAWAQSRHELSQELAQQALTLYRELGDAPGTVKALSNLGYAASATGDLDRARDLYEEALAIAQAPRDRVVALNCLSDLALRTRDLDRAAALAQQARKEAVDDESTAVATFNLGYIALIAGRPAAAHLREAARAFDRLGDQETVALALDGLALATEDPDEAARYLGAADARREAVGAAASFEDELRAQGAASIRARAAAHAFAAGAELSIDELLGSGKDPP